MNFFDPRRGELLFSAASLLVFFSAEILKWQFPAQAAGEKLSGLRNALQRMVPQAALGVARR